MAGALAGAISCARCAAASSKSDRFCTRCGVLLLPASHGSVIGTYSGMLAGVFPAANVRRNSAIAIDALPVVVGVAASIVLVAGDSVTDQAVWLALGLFLFLYLTGHSLARTLRGRSLGRLTLGLRTVDDLTGDPVGFGRWLRGIRSKTWLRRMVTADLRRGRDPLEISRGSLAASALRAAASIPGISERTPAASVRSDDSPVAAVSIVLDSGERLEVSSSLLLGRAPENKDDDKHPAIAWPDLSRSLSKTHALLEWSGTVLWVTDLGSTNGSALIGPEGDRQLLVPGLRGAAAVGFTIELGDRSIEVRPSAAVVA